MVESINQPIIISISGMGCPPGTNLVKASRPLDGTNRVLSHQFYCCDSKQNTYWEIPNNNRKNRGDSFISETSSDVSEASSDVSEDPERTEFVPPIQMRPFYSTSQDQKEPDWAPW